MVWLNNAPMWRFFVWKLLQNQELLALVSSGSTAHFVGENGQFLAFLAPVAPNSAAEKLRLFPIDFWWLPQTQLLGQIQVKF